MLGLIIGIVAKLAIILESEILFWFSCQQNYAFIFKFCNISGADIILSTKIL